MTSIQPIPRTAFKALESLASAETGLVWFWS